MKSQQRLKKIIEDYARDIQKGVYSSVLYYCGNKEIGQKVLGFARGMAADWRLHAYNFLDKSEIGVEQPETTQPEMTMNFDFSKFLGKDK